MWFWGIAVIAAGWVALDARGRKVNPILWGIGTLFLLPIILPLYFATRPLKFGETREGGRAWNVLRNFALAWTVFMAAAAVAGFIAAGSTVTPPASEAERVGAGIGLVLGMGLLGALWFFPMVGAVVLGFLLKKTVIETGPTGPLAEYRAPTVERAL